MHCQVALAKGCCYGMSVTSACAARIVMWRGCILHGSVLSGCCTVVLGPCSALLTNFVICITPPNQTASKL
jgi:hypothetical protein